MAEVLVVGKKISEMDLVTDIVGDEKIPTGVVGDKAVTTGQLLTYLDNNGKVQWGRIEGDIANQADLQNQFTQQLVTLQNHIQDQGNPHNVTKEQVGLGLVDNTSDMDKPVSTAVQEALSLKSDQTYVDDSLANKTHNSLLGREADGAHPTRAILDGSGVTQQQVNDLTGAPYRVKVGGYNVGERVVLESGDIVKSTVANNTNDPNVNMTGWVSDTDLIVKSIAELRTKVGRFGQIARTLNYHDGVNGGGATYKWVGGTEDNGFNKIHGWELIFTGEVDIRCGGAVVNPPEVASQNTLFNTVIDNVSAMGGGIVHFPAGTFYGSIKSAPNVEVRGRINIDMTPATLIQHYTPVSGNDNANINASKPYFKAKNFELSGLVGGAYGGNSGLRITAPFCEFENIVSHSHRYDALAIAGNTAAFCKIKKSVFKYTGRNVASITGGHDISFEDCEFLEDSAVTGSSLYLIDIEPNSSSNIWYNISFKNCKINRVTESPNGAVFFDQKEINPYRVHGLTFENCDFLGYAYLSPRGDYEIKGFNLINCTFERMPFSVAGSTTHYIKHGVIRGNKFSSTTRFSYLVDFLGDVVFEDNEFSSSLGLPVNTATFGVNTFIGITPVPVVDRRSSVKQRTLGTSNVAVKTSTVKRVDISNTTTFSLTLPNQSAGVLRIRSATEQTLNNGLANTDVHFLTRNGSILLNTIDNMGVAATSDVSVTSSGTTITLSRSTTAIGTYLIELEFFSTRNSAGVTALTNFNA